MVDFLKVTLSDGRAVSRGPFGVSIRRPNGYADAFLRLKGGKFTLEKRGQAPVALPLAEAAAAVGQAWTKTPRNLDCVNEGGLRSFVRYVEGKSTSPRKTTMTKLPVKAAPVAKPQAKPQAPASPVARAAPMVSRDRNPLKGGWGRVAIGHLSVIEPSRKRASAFAFDLLPASTASIEPARISRRKSWP
jgi:hypothetical protein